MTSDSVNNMDQTHYEDLLSQQLLMNQQTGAALQKHGVNEQTELRLDCSYVVEGLRSLNNG